MKSDILMTSFRIRIVLSHSSLSRTSLESESKCVTWRQKTKNNAHIILLRDVSRSRAISWIQLGTASMSRLRSSSLKKPPEPLRRAVTDCLSAAASSQVEASGTLRE
ncbi:hypothetical protein C2S52_020790 [Perilla frutescens var. hirtella]|nr:hypothetical protein C2S52_020790 [Perilla frutescens var. hirtella]KAH6805099.1 hypothetical protein C2S51_029930 [Perilla frutescens var. frutescens]